MKTNTIQARPDAGATKGMELLNDVARCNGVGSDAEGWREGCETCLRRTANRAQRVTMMQRPPVIAFECEFLIEPKS